MTVGPEDFFKRIEESGLLSDSIVEQRGRLRAVTSGEEAAADLVSQKLLTAYQSEVLLSGEDVPLVLGDYVVTESIGRGGMGYVLKARHRRMKRQVAIKFLLKSLTDSDDLRRRFEREVEAAAQLDHQNIVTAYDAGVHEGSHYLVMQYVDGEDLSQIVKSSGPMDIPDAVDVIRQAALGLGYAHDRGIIHRDIKPGNLLLDSEGVVRILDMGLARMTPSPGDELEGGAQADLTNTGSVMGTIDYMAPEQALDAKSVDARADLYALGCTLYFLLTSNPPFRNETVMRRLLAHREQPAPRISEYRPGAPRELDDIFATMMAKSPDDRFPSMKHLVVALDSLGLNDSEDEQMATLDVPDDGNGGFVKLPDVGEPSISDSATSPAMSPQSGDESSTGATRRLPDSDVTILETPTHASAMSALENAVAISPDSTSPDTDFTGVGETIIGGSPSVAGAAAARGAKSQPPWKLIAPVGLAIVALIAFLMTSADPDALDSEPNSVAATPQGDTQPDDSQHPESSPIQSPDRRVAEWVLSIGGEVAVVVNGTILQVADASELPTDAFVMRTVDLYKNELVSDADLAQLRELKSLNGLYLQSTRITDAGLARLKGFPVEQIVLQGTKVTDVGVEALSHDTRLKRLMLGFTDVTDESAAHLSRLTNLTSLSLNETEVSGKTLEQIQGLPLTLLSIQGTAIKGSDLDSLVGFPELENLSVDGSQVSDVGGQHIAKLKGITHFQVFGGEGMKSDFIKKMTDLETLTFVSVGEDADIENLKDLPKLSFLKLQQADITDAGLSRLRQLPALTVLTLMYCAELTDEGLRHLHELKQLTSLNLTSNETLAVDGITELAAALPDCRIISDHGTFGPPAAPMTPDRRAAEVALELGGTVSVRVASGETLPIKALAELPTTPFFVTDIVLGNLPRVNDDSLTHFRGLSGLLGLSLSNDSITDRGLANLTDEGRQPLPDLLRLQLNGTEVSQDGLQFLSGSSELQLLLITDTAITSGDVLGQFPKLNMLNVARTSIKANELRVIRQLPQLGILAVDAHHFSGETATDIAALSGLHKLALHGASDFESSVLSRMESLKELNVLECAADALDGQFWKSVAGLRGLETLSFSGGTDQSLAEVSSMPQLRRFEARSNTVSGMALAKAMSKFPNVKSLTVAYSAWSDDDVQQLQGLKSLRELDLRQNTASAEAIKALSAALPDCRIISDHGMFDPLDAAAMNLDRRAAEVVLELGGSVHVVPGASPNLMLIEELAKLPTEPFVVSQIHLNDNPSVDDECLTGFRGLSELKVLDLAGATITDRGLLNLTDAGRIPLPALRTLYLNGARVSQKGLQYLSGSDELERLILSGTAITDGAVLAQFPGLQMLVTAETPLQEVGMDVVAKLPLLHQLRIDGRHFAGPNVNHIAGLRNLKEITLDDMPSEIDSSALARLSQLTSLAVYNPASAAIDDDFWKAVVTLEKLRSLTIAGSDVSGELFSGALPMPQLRVLEVQSGHVRGSAVAKAMSNFPNLTSLEIRHSSWTDDDIRQLHDLKSLPQLKLSGHKASAEAIKALSAALPDCRIISDHGTFGPSAVAMTSDRRAAELVLGLGGSVTVRVASGQTGQITTPAKLPTIRFVVTHIHLGDMEGVDDDCLTHFRGLNDLYHLTVLGGSVTDRGLANLTDEGRQPSPGLRELYLTGTGVSQDGLQFLSGSRELHSLLISQTAIASGDVLAQFPNMQRLHLDRTPIETNELQVIRKLPELGALHIDARHFSGETATHIAGLQRLHDLTLHGASDFESSVLARMESLKSLRFHGCSANAFDGAFWKAVAGLSGLETLQFSSGVTDQSLANVSSMPQLRSFDVSSRAVSGTALAKAMSKFPNVTSLTVTYSAWSDDDVQQFHGLKSLRELELRGNPASAEAIKALSAALPDCRIISDHGTFGPPAVAMTPDRRAAEWVLSVGGSLGIDSPDGTRLQVEDRKDLPDGPFVVVKVGIGYGSQVTDDGLMNLRGCLQLGAIHAFDTAITDQGLANLTDEGRQPLENLTSLFIARTRVSNTGLEYLAGSKGLLYLDIQTNPVSDGSLLGNFRQLSSLDIVRSKISAEELSILRGLPLLRKLSVDGRQLEGVGSQHVSSLNKLSELIVQYPWSGFDGAVLRELEGLTKLGLLELPENRLDDNLWAAVGGVLNLEDLSLSGNGVTDASIGNMPALPELEVLTLKNGEKKLSGETIAEAVRRTPALTELIVSHNELNDADARFLESLTQLSRLQLADNDITAAAIQLLHEKLPNCRIESDHGTFKPTVAAMTPDRRAAEAALTLGGTVVVRDAAGSMVSVTDPGEFPTGAFAVTKIDLSNKKNIEDEFLANFRGLADLQILVLTETSITDRGLANLTDEGRQPLPSLQRLYLDGTKISQTGLKFLSGSHALWELLLNGTAVSQSSVLSQFPNLTVIDIGDTSLTSDDLQIIAEFSNLERLTMDANRLTETMASVLAGLRELRALKLRDLPSDFDPDHLAGLALLTELYVNADDSMVFDDDFWKVIAGLRELHILMCKGVTDESLAKAQPTPQVEVLIVMSRVVTGEAFVKSMLKFPNVKSLTVNYSDWTDNDVQQLHSLKSLGKLDVTKNSASVEAIKTLSAALPKCQIISDHGTFEPTKTE